MSNQVGAWEVLGSMFLFPSYNVGPAQVEDIGQGQRLPYASTGPLYHFYGVLELSTAFWVLGMDEIGQQSSLRSKLYKSAKQSRDLKVP